jgi:hypothetical protein
MPEVWEQESYLRARPCFRGDIEEELKLVDVDGQHTEAARTTTGAKASSTTGRKVSDRAQIARVCASQMRDPDASLKRSRPIASNSCFLLKA